MFAVKECRVASATPEPMRPGQASLTRRGVVLLDLDPALKGRATFNAPLTRRTACRLQPAAYRLLRLSGGAKTGKLSVSVFIIFSGRFHLRSHEQ